MKVLILGVPRTRSSYFIDIISKHFNLDNYFEIYQDLQNGSWRSRIWSNENYWDLYFDKIKKLTDDLINKDNYSIKIFSNILISPDLKQIFTDIDFLQFKKYDRVYFLYRKNIIDLIISQILARRINKFLYTSENSIPLIGYQEPLDLTQNKILREIDYIIASLIIHDKIKNYLIKEKINFVELEYNDIPDYLKNQFPKINSDYKEIGIDYSNVLKNYLEVAKHIELRKDLICEIMGKHEFK